MSNSNSDSDSKMLTLISSDQHQFTVEQHVAVQCITVKNMVDEGGVSPAFSLTGVDSKTLTLVIEYLHKQASSLVEKDDLKKFVENREMSTLIALTNAASYLDVKELLDLVCQKMADLIKDMTVEEVREAFQITNDFTPVEEQAIYDEHPWAFEI